jgi:predicted double-glycine peptidase
MAPQRYLIVSVIILIVFFFTVGITPATASEEPWFKGIYKQSKTYSCGAATLATILTWWLGRPTTEEDVLRLFFRDASNESADLVKQRGLSFQELSKIAIKLGYQDRWGKIRFEDIRKVSHPVIIFINYDGQPHFSILRGIINDEAYIADPSLGNIIIPLDEFQNLWALSDNGKTGLVWTVQHPDHFFIKNSSLLLTSGNVPPHRTFDEMRASQVINQGSPNNLIIGLSFGYTNASDKFSFYSKNLEQNSENFAISASVKYWLDYGLSFQAAIPYSKNISTLGQFKQEIESLNEIKLSVEKGVISIYGIGLIGAIQSQIPLTRGAFGVGGSVFVTRPWQKWTPSLEASYIYQFNPVDESLQSIARPRHTFLFDVGVQYLASYTLSFSGDAFIAHSSSETLGLGERLSSDSFGFRVGLATSIAKGITFQPSLSIERWNTGGSVSFSSSIYYTL